MRNPYKWGWPCVTHEPPVGGHTVVERVEGFRVVIELLKANNYPEYGFIVPRIKGNRGSRYAQGQVWGLASLADCRVAAMAFLAGRLDGIHIGRNQEVNRQRGLQDQGKNIILS